MNCHDALARLLEADLEGDLDAGTTQDAALAAHLAGCARCARAAAVIRGDTMAVATAVRAGRVQQVRAKRRVPLWMPGLALAATAVLMVVFASGEATIRAASSVRGGVPASVERPVSLPDANAQAIADAPDAPRAVVPRAASSRSRSSTTPAVASAVAVHASRIDAVSFSAEPMQVERFAVAPVVDENVANGLRSMPDNLADSARAPAITVTNKLGTRAMVARTADPNIVVVWLSDESNRRNPR